MAESRNPHPLIELNYIKSRYPERFSAVPRIDELLAFLRDDVGDPGPNFSNLYYVKSVGSDEILVSGGMLKHFLQFGILQGRKPVPGLGIFYKYQHMKVKSFDIRDTLNNYERSPVIAKKTGPNLSPYTENRCNILRLPNKPREIHLYCLAWNEAFIVPFFLRHYGKIVDRFFVFDNGSIDSTVTILKREERVQVRHFDMIGDSFVEQERQMSDTVWKDSRGRAAWVIFIDMDEFLYHTDLRGYLDRCTDRHITAIDARAYEMVSDQFPPSEVQLTKTIRCGVREPFYDKLCIFNPESITSTNFAPGRHFARPMGSVSWPAVPEVLLLHYKRLGIEHVVQRYAKLSTGLREGDVRNRWGVQYLMTRAEIEREFRAFQRNAAPVPGLGGWTDPDPRFVLDGRVVLPAEADHNVYTFLLPDNGHVLRLVSNATELEGAAASSPFRGIPVCEIVLHGVEGTHVISPDDHRLSEGWSDLENVGSGYVRWTKGNATVPMPPGGATVVEVHLRWPTTPVRPKTMLEDAACN
jgi:hypothetical protein